MGSLNPFGGKSSPSGNTTNTVTQNNNPWSGQQPHLNTLFSEAEKLRAQGGPAYFPGSTLAPVSPFTNQSIDQRADRALSGSPVQAGANQLATDTLAGDYLNSNPYLDETFNRAAGQVEGRMRSAWGGSDEMTGSSGLQQAALGNSLSGLANSIYGGNYQNERNRQMGTIAAAPGLAAADYNDINQLGAAGDLQRGLGQQGINDAIERYNYEQNLPYLNLQNFGQLVSGNYGGSGTQTATTPYFANSPGLLGGALSGGLIGDMFGYPKTGAAAGAMAGKA